MIQKIEHLLKTDNTTGSVYDEFRKNSVLTENQLNKLTDYFEDADRLRTTKLHGVGIVCGLQYKVFSDAQILNKIEITPGVVITTDGDLLNSDIKLKILTHFKPFSNKGSYSRLLNGNVVEMVEEGVAGSLNRELPLTLLKNETGFRYKDYKLVLYLDHYKVNPGLCSATSCDDTGNHVHMDLKYLLVHEDTWRDTLMREDTIFHEHDLWRFYDGLPNIQINRAVLKLNNCNTVNEVYNLFQQEFNGWGNLRDAFTDIINRFSSRIDFVYHGINTTNITNYFSAVFSNLPSQIDIQYRYDLYKDLVETYTEIKSLILHLNIDCSPAINAFPKHVSLGSLKKPNDVDCRHRFYYSPLHKDKKHNLARFKFLVIRFWKQLTSYNVIPSPIRVTSSRDFEFKLGERAIPYYYNYNKLAPYWNYELSRNREHRLNHSYYTGSGGSMVDKPNVVSHLGKEFYRIEGHLGKPHHTTLAEINALKRSKGLAFDVKTISIGLNDLNVNWEDYQCEFKDLESMLKSWQLDFNCLTKGFEEFFGNMPINRPYFQLETQIKANTNKEKAGLVNTREVEFAEVSIHEAVKQQEVSAEWDCKAAERVISHYPSETMNHDTMKVGITQNVKMYMMMHFFVNQKRCWSEFLNDAAYIDSVKDKIDLFCEDRSIMHKALTDYINKLKTNSDSDKGKTDEFLILDVLSTFSRLKDVCCYSSKLDWLKTEIEKRKKAIMSKLVAAEVVKKHPGAVHMAGVPIAGTFLMVYSGSNIQGDNPFKVNNQVVVADFALPYMCCSDCAPSQVIITPEPPIEDVEVTISLPNNEFCSDDETEYPFTISPERANATILGVGVVKNNEGHFFNPSLASNGENTFTVNDNLSNFQVTVFQTPVANFTSEIIGNKLIIEDTSSPHALIQNYKVNNNSVVGVFDSDRKVRIDISNVNVNTITVELKLQNGVCISKYKSELDFQREIIHPNFSIEKVPNKNNYHFTNLIDIPLNKDNYYLKVNDKKIPLYIIKEDVLEIEIQKPSNILIVLTSNNYNTEYTTSIDPKEYDLESYEVLVSEVKKELNNIENALIRKEPRLETLKIVKEKQLAYFNQIYNTIQNKKDVLQVAKEIIKNPSFYVLNDLNKTEISKSKYYSEVYFKMVFNLLKLINDVEYQQLIAPVYQKHYDYYETYLAHFSDEFIPYTQAMQFSSAKVAQYVDEYHLIFKKNIK